MINEVDPVYSDSLGASVARFLVFPPDQLPSLREVEAQLDKALDMVHSYDQVSNDIIAGFIRQNKNWSSYARLFDSTAYYIIDTFIENPDGSFSYIAVDYKVPNSEQIHWSIREDVNARVQESALSSLPRLFDGEIIDVDDLNAFIVGTSKSASVHYFSPDSVSLLRADAEDDTSNIDLFRQYYRRKRFIQIESNPFAKSGYITLDTPSNERIDQLVSSGDIMISKVVLGGKVPRGESAADHIQGAQHIAAHRRAEKATHGDEYHMLVNKYRYDDALSEDERAAIFARLAQIQAANGNPEAHPLDWTKVMPKFYESWAENRITESEVWDKEVLEALIHDLGDLGLYLYERSIKTRLAAAHTIRLALISGDKSSTNCINSVTSA